MVSESSRSSLVNRRQLDIVDGGTWCDGVVRIGSGQFSESIVLVELDYKVLCSMWSAPILFVPKSRGTSLGFGAKAELSFYSGASMVVRVGRMDLFFGIFFKTFLVV